jgi:hypothetical protein
MIRGEFRQVGPISSCISLVGCDMKRKALYMELAGMILVLASVGWQFFIGRPLETIESSSRDYREDRKLDAIWWVLTDMYTHQFPERAGTTGFANWKSLNMQWEHHGEGEERSIELQAKMATWFTGIVFLIGSALIVAAKWFEIRADQQAQEAGV